MVGRLLGQKIKFRRADKFSVNRLAIFTGLEEKDWVYRLKHYYVALVEKGEDLIGYMVFTTGTGAFFDEEALLEYYYLPKNFFNRKVTKDLRTMLNDVYDFFSFKQGKLVSLHTLDEEHVNELVRFKESGWFAVPTKNGKYTIEGPEEEQYICLSV